MHPTAKTLLSGLMILLALPGSAPAAVITSEYQLDALLPRQEGLAILRKKIAANPGEKENYYAYARLASALGRPEDVAWAYERVLVIDPSLDRIRLDLSLIYIGLGRLDEARALLNIVLNKNPPETVQQNIRAVLARIDKAQRKHHFSGSATLGFGYDSNANAAPNSGNIEVLDTSVPLGDEARAERDLQAFATVTLSHIYDIGSKSNLYAFRWHNSALTYNTRQDDFLNLNLNLINLRSGPEIIYLPLDLHVTMLAGYNHMLLDGQSYLRNPGVEVKADFPLPHNGLRGWVGAAAEQRDFINSDTIKTYEARSGRVVQAQAGLRYPYSERSLWETAFTWRRERAKEDYYANNQTGIWFSNTYGFSSQIADGWLTDVFSVVRVAYKHSVYDNPDVLTSNENRDDREYSAQLTLGRKIANDMTLAGSYTFTDNLSSLENYRYSNHRVTVSVSKGF